MAPPEAHPLSALEEARCYSAVQDASKLDVSARSPEKNTIRYGLILVAVCCLCLVALAGCGCGCGSNGCGCGSAPFSSWLAVGVTGTRTLAPQSQGSLSRPRVVDNMVGNPVGHFNPSTAKIPTHTTRQPSIVSSAMHAHQAGLEASDAPSHDGTPGYEFSSNFRIVSLLTVPVVMLAAAIGYLMQARPLRQAMMATEGSKTPKVPPAWPGRCIPPTEAAEIRPKCFSLIGSTGSIGTQTLDIVEEHPDRFSICALAAGNNIELLAEQTKKFKPSLICISDEKNVPKLKELLKGCDPMPEIVTGAAGICEVARHPDAHAVVTGIVGCAGLEPTVAAIKAGKDICLANKETLIAGGPYVLPLAKEHGINILPADSEHSALFQCIQGLPEGGLRRIILTASGGAFRDRPVETLDQVRVEDAIKHPNWSMGKKITVDSATLMNKGLEVIEAHYLYGTDYDNIDIVIHPQSIIHSMVETSDSSVLGQLGWPDMRLPILYTMSWPYRVPTSEKTWPRLDFFKMGDLTFKEPDTTKYPSMDLAYAAGRAGGTMTGVLSAANEQAVQMFLDEEIGYLDICRVVEACCDKHKSNLIASPGLDEIVHYDAWARDFVRDLVRGGSFKPQIPK